MSLGSFTKGSPELAQLTSLRSAVRTALHAFTVIATAVPPFLINFPPMRLHATTSSDEDAYQVGCLSADNVM